MNPRWVLSGPTPSRCVLLGCHGCYRSNRCWDWGVGVTQNGGCIEAMLNPIVEGSHHADRGECAR